jgi:predicted esterase
MRRSLLLLVVAVAAAAVLVAPAGHTGAPAPSLPSGGPPALYAPEPSLPAPAHWPFGEAFPRTSGFGRLAGGASFWSDFVYDDRGAAGVPVSSPVISLSPADGTYAYPDGPAAENGADIFRAAVGADDSSTWWRVDWQTLASADLPAALWAFDTDASSATGTAAWPAGAGVASPGVERWLLVTSRGAWLIDGTGTRTAVESWVDTGSRSFVARVPRTALPADAGWTVRLASGLASADGASLAPVGPDAGALPGQPALFNVAFRTDAQEAVVPENWWREDAQAAALAAGDVSAFGLAVDWADLLAKRATPEPRPTGFTNRWYVSSVEQGQGIVRNPPQWSSDMAANYLNRVQPYAVYVPDDVDPSVPVPLMVLLHSLNIQHNQYGAFNPSFLEAACGARRVICVTPFGRGPDSWYFAEGELDVWEVWNRVAAAYALDPARTIISGYSMGGFGTYRFGLEHPDLFAQAVALAGPPNCSVRVLKGLEVPANVGQTDCETESDQSVLVENGRELPFYIGQGAIDELVLSPSIVEQAKRFDDLGFRHRFELYPNNGHVAWAETGHFEGAAAWLADRVRAPDPATITYRFYTSHQHPELGIGPSGAWWLSGLVARGSGPGLTARVVATSHALAARTPEVVRSQDAVTNADGAAVVQELQWSKVTEEPGGEARIDLQLESVSAATIDLARAGVGAGRDAVIAVQSDGPATLSVAGQTFSVGAGASTVQVLAGRVQLPAPAPSSLAATGGPGWALPAGLVLALLALLSRALVRVEP